MAHLNSIRNLSQRLPSPHLLQLPSRRPYATCCHHYAQGLIEGHGDHGYEVHQNAFKFGNGVLRELGEDARQVGLAGTRVALFTDRRVAQMEATDVARRALESANCEVVVYDEVAVEPTDGSFREAARFARDGAFSGYVSVGGGSVMDTCKAANLYATYPVADFLEYVNPPIGRGKAPPGDLKPHIACPTTCGTGSECTGFAIFDLLSMRSKTGIAHHKLRPTRAVIDPTTTLSLPANIVAASGFDVFSHALESYTAQPYTRRRNGFKLGVQRPQSQGANPYSDMGCLEALELIGQYFVRAVKDHSDTEAREQMMLASTLAGTAMGNCGVHLCHGMSYSVSGMVRDYRMEGYPKEHPMVPHGVSVILNAPSVFKYIAPSTPKRVLRCLGALGEDIRGATEEDAPEIVYQTLVKYMKATGMPGGLEQVGYSASDIPELVKATFPQKRVIDNAPIDITQNDLSEMFRGALKYY